MFSTKDHLRVRAVAFCQAFVDGLTPDTILSQFFVSNNPRITEHGKINPELPFLGKSFSGRKSNTVNNQTCDDYFELLSKTLKFDPRQTKFPSPESFLVDETCEINGRMGVVSVVANGHFQSVKTGKAWNEVFIYRLSEFDEEGKIGHWEIWADTLSAWEAVHS